ncbi:MAG: D-2-hydroxyacid dehydrogenase [Chitinophagaceae bacterium]|nr:D-2-hydroxyacid dehydrogenase [Chitinophagaceae bacterium]
MGNSHLSRRGFITAVGATGAATVADFTPLPSLANTAQPVEQLNPDRQIKIVSTNDLDKDVQQKIKTVARNIDLQIVNDNSSAALEDAEVVIGDVNASMLQRAKKLKWVQVMHAGVENMPKEVIAHPLVLTNMQKIFSPVIAEQAIALLLSLTRGLVQLAIPSFEKKQWKRNPSDGTVMEDLYNKTIGIVGMGGIGSDTARRLHYGFNMRVLATDAKPMHKPAFVEELHDPGWFMEMVPQVDVLMSAAPLTKETREMFNEEAFGKMKRTAYFINVSRGGLVKNAALVDALKNKKIRGAGLDVATPEPLPPDHEFWTCPNLVITAHNSTEAASRDVRMNALLVENVRRYSLGLPLMNVVDKEKGY